MEDVSPLPPTATKMKPKYYRHNGGHVVLVMSFAASVCTVVIEKFLSHRISNLNQTDEKSQNSTTTSVSFSGSSVPLQLGLPVAVPPQYSGLKEVSIEVVRTRLRLLYHFSDLMYSSWRLLNLSPNNQVGKEPEAPVVSE